MGIPQPPASRRTHLRGLELLHNPALNKGTAFSADERRALGLEGLLPDQVETLDQQVRRVWEWFGCLESPLERFVFVDGLRRTNLTLFHRFLEEHVEAVLPIVYTPTVGTVIQAFSRRYRSPMAGIFLSARHRGRLKEVLAASLGGPVDLLLVLSLIHI